MANSTQSRVDFQKTSFYRDLNPHIRYITIEYLPRDLKIPDQEFAQKYFDIIKALPGNDNIKNIEMFLEQLLIDFKDIQEYGREHCKKQCVEFARQLKLSYANNICSTWSDLCNLWGSKEGLDQHHRIWQVTWNADHFIYYYCLID